VRDRLPADHTALGEGPEFDRIRAIWTRLGRRAAVSGDDCALVPFGGTTLAVSTDMAVDGTHFQSEWLSWPELGWRLGAAALSDLAAVGAEPRGILTSVGAGPAAPATLVADLMDGMGRVAESVGATVWGGDLVRSTVLAIDVTVIGQVTEPLLRRGARAGDGLWVTGRLGAPLAALRAWEAGSEPGAEARERFAHPVPRVGEAHWLRTHGARAAIDISDGLVADAGHLAAASGVACAIDVSDVPIHPAADDPLDGLLSGEEYELLVALPGEFDPGAANAFGSQFALDLTRVGSVVAGRGVTVTDRGEHVALPTGFLHFEG
jgi:thiamine-monophosphate kinase